MERVFPILTPLAVDPGHPFPYISNISLNLGVLLRPCSAPAEEEPRFARVKIPGNVPRLIRVNETSKFVLLDHLVSAHIRSLFPAAPSWNASHSALRAMPTSKSKRMKPTTFLKSVQQTLRQRRFGFGVRLEVASAMSVPMIEVLRQSLQLEKQDVYSVEGPMNIPDLMALYRLDLPNAKDKPFEPVAPAAFREGESMFDAIRHQDVLLHHPYESFMPVGDFFRSAAKDPNVLAIKATLYRVGSDSPSFGR